MNLLLASKSKRRRLLVAMLNLPYRFLDVTVNESLPSNTPPSRFVVKLSETKMEGAFSKYSKVIKDHDILLSADTIIYLGSTIFNKPSSKEESFTMMDSLQGRSHFVFTGFTLQRNQQKTSSYEKTKVTLDSMSKDEINSYIETTSTQDMAGGYGIQDPYLSRFISRIEGCYYNVMGLPLSKINRTLKKKYL